MIYSTAKLLGQSAYLLHLQGTYIFTRKKCFFHLIRGCFLSFLDHVGAKKNLLDFIISLAEVQTRFVDTGNARTACLLAFRVGLRRFGSSTWRI